jgi:hypothetical protein
MTMAIPEQAIPERLLLIHGHDALTRDLRDLASDVLGTTDPLDLPVELGIWLNRAIVDASEHAADRAQEVLLEALAQSLATAPADHEHRRLMDFVTRAQSIHVVEVR